MVGPAKSHILETEIDDEISLYDPRTERVTVLNETASDVWRLVDGQHSLDQITRLIASAYRVSPDDISADVAETVKHFAEAGLIDIQ
jgi:hypothetical protein